MDLEKVKELVDSILKKSASDKPEITPDEMEAAITAGIAKANLPSDEELEKSIQAEVTKQVDAFRIETERKAEIDTLIAKALEENQPADLTPTEKANRRIAPTGGAPAILRSDRGVTKSGRRYGKVPEDEFSMVRMIKAMGENNYEGASEEIQKDYDGVDDIEKAMSTENLEEGGITLPSPTASRMIDVLRARMVTDKAGVTHVPMTDATLTIPVLDADAGVFWGVADNDDLPEGEGLKFAGRSLILKDLTALIPIPNKLLEDSSFDMERMLRDSITKKVALASDIARLRGTGGNMPVGLQNYTGVTQVTGVALADWDFEAARNFINLAELAESELTSFIMHPTLLHQLQGQVDGEGRPIYNVDPAAPQRRLLFGFPVWTTTNSKDVTTATNLLVFGGDWSEVLIGGKGGLKIDADKSIGFKQNVTWVRAMLREDLVIEHPAVMVRQTIDAS